MLNADQSFLVQYYYYHSCCYSQHVHVHVNPLDGWIGLLTNRTEKPELRTEPYVYSVISTGFSEFSELSRFR